MGSSEVFGDWTVQITMVGGGGRGILAITQEPGGAAVEFLTPQRTEAKVGSQAMAWTGVRVDGPSFEGEFKVEGSMPVPTTFTIQGTVDGDEITGSIGFGLIGSGTFFGTRA